jgi:hypothetical protein
MTNQFLLSSPSGQPLDLKWAQRMETVIEEGYFVQNKKIQSVGSRIAMQQYLGSKYARICAMSRNMKEAF